MIIANDIANSLIVSNINTLITTLGGTVGTYAGSTGIYVNYVPLLATSLATLTTGTSGYDDTYDAVLYWNGLTYTPLSDTAGILNTYYNNNRGVVLGTFADTTNTPVNLS